VRPSRLVLWPHADLLYKSLVTWGLSVWRFAIGRGKFKPSGENCSCAISQPHIPHLPLWHWTEASLVRTQQLDFWAAYLLVRICHTVLLSRTSDWCYGGTCFNPHGYVGFPVIGMCGFPQSLQTNCAPGPQIGMCLLPPTFFPIHYLYVNHNWLWASGNKSISTAN
jgi:hypothetical protein